MRFRHLRRFPVALVLAVLVACAGDAPPTDSGTVQSVSVAPPEATIAVGHVVVLEATVTVEGAASKAVAWSTASDEVEVDAEGAVLGVSAGEAVVRATSTADASKWGQATVTVVDVPSVPFTLAPGEAAAVVGGSLESIAPIVLGDGVRLVSDDVVVELTARDAGGVAVRVPVRDPVLRIPSSGLIDVTLSGLAAMGRATVWLLSDPILLGGPRSDSDGALNASLGIPAEASVGSHALVVTLEDADGVPRTLGVGVDVIDAGQPAVIALSIDQAEPTVTVGGSLQLTATVVSVNGADALVTWNASPTDVATVDAATGLVTGLDAGEATITVTSAADAQITDAVVLTVLPASAPDALSITTGGELGIFYPLGVAYAEVIDRFVDGHTATARISNGSVQNVARLAQGEDQLGFAAADVALAAFGATGVFEGSAPLDGLRTVAVAYSNAVHVLSTASAGIGALSDLEGKRVSLGRASSSTELDARAVLEANDVEVGEAVNHPLFGDALDALADGSIDAAFVVMAAGGAALSAFAEQVDLVLVPLDATEIAAVTSAEARFTPFTFTAGTYGLSADVGGVGVPQLLLALDQLDAGLIEAFVEALFEHIDLVKEASPTAAETTPEALLTAPVPLHRGTLNYLESIDLEVVLAPRSR
jgi:uncharacterized protein